MQHGAAPTPSSFSKACSAVALTAWLSFFLSAAAATAVAPSTAMVGALPRAEPLEPRAPRREPELGAELRGPVAVASVVPVAETGDFRYTTELLKESRRESGDSNHPKTWSHMSRISGHSMT